ncbi:MAG TPA: carboxypeptidase-like regulatory domain-containing protein, partial [Kofleriaceae bacterium]|nr:carboxypeptidase-like regulatory domain-containing protein [Kofleriaceae bacterium]
MKRSMLLLALAACGAGDQGDAPLGPGGDGAGPPTGAGGQTCAVQVVLPRDPEPVASATTPVMVRAVVSEAPGTLHFQWQVRRDGTTIATTVQTSDGSQVSFLAPIAGVYDVRLDVLGALTGCPTVIQAVNVDAPDAVSAPYRIRVAPGLDAPAAPFETTTTIRGGATRQLGPLTAPPSVPIDFHVVAAATGAAVPALVHLIPLGAAFPDPGVANEAFSDAAGRVELRAPSGLADAIVVPVQPGLAAQRFTRVQPGAIFALTAATLTGSVRDPGGAPLAGAKVQLAVDGLPSSLATTASNGTFTVFAEAAAGQTLTLEVTPPAASGLPRLTATSSKLDVTAPLQIAYGANLTRRDLAGLVVTRDGAPLPRARLTVVGAIGAGGTVTTGGPPVVATGEVVLGAT